MRFSPQLTPPDTNSPAETSGDAELVRQAQRRPEAFAPLYLAYRDLILNYCYYRLHNRVEAEDAASSTFVKALHGIQRFRDGSDSFRSWLFRIAHNEVVDRLKQDAR